MKSIIYITLMVVLVLGAIIGSLTVLDVISLPEARETGTKIALVIGILVLTAFGLFGITKLKKQ